MLIEIFPLSARGPGWGSHLNLRQEVQTFFCKRIHSSRPFHVDKTFFLFSCLTFLINPLCLLEKKSVIRLSTNICLIKQLLLHLTKKKIK